MHPLLLFSINVWTIESLAFQGLFHFGNIDGGPEKDRVFVCGGGVVFYALSPRIRLASWMSFGMMVTLFAWIAHKFVSSNNLMRYASTASCKAPMAECWNRRSCLKSCAISLTSLANGAFLMSRLVLFW